jgi:hypothetical protein
LGGSPVEPKAAGAAFVLLDGAGAVLPVSGEERGAQLMVAAHAPDSSPGDDDARRVPARYDGVDLRPLRPVHVRVRRRGGDLELSWIRRDRIQSDAWTGVEIPMSEAREAYRVVLVNAGETVESRETTVPALNLSAADLSALFPGGLAQAQVRIAQISSAYGPGAIAEAPLTPTAYG